MSQRISSSLSQKISNMGVFAMFCILCMHCPWRTTNFVEGGVYLMAKACWRIAVPYFFVTSGYFLAMHTEGASWWSREVKKRIRSLIVPYFCWGVAWMGLYAVLAYFSGRECGSVLLAPHRLFDDIGLNPIALPAVGQLWYVRSLFVLVLLSPLVKRFNSLWFLVLTFLAYGAICPRGEDLNTIQAFFRITLSVEGLFYFAVGFYLYKHPIGIPFKWSMILLAIGLLGMLTFVYCSIKSSSVQVYLIRWFSIPFVLQGVWALMPSWKLPKVITTGTFPAFLLHRFFIIPCGMFGVSSLICRSLFTSFCFVCVIWLLSVIVVPTLLRKFMSRASAILFGGR